MPPTDYAIFSPAATAAPSGNAAAAARLAQQACCAPPRPLLPAPPSARRMRLAEIDALIHCSIVGTCLSTAELRRLTPRHAPQLDRARASDLEIHHTAVALSTEGGALAKELNKALDARHAATIKRFRGATSAEALATLWRAALASGDVPGAYWALMSHPAATFALRQEAFGDVHMLSHLVGASNRADLRRLVALEHDCDALREQTARQQERLHAMQQQHEQRERQLHQQVLALSAQCQQAAAVPAGALSDDVPSLRLALQQCEQKVLLHSRRCEEAEQRRQAQHESAKAMQERLAGADADTATARAETAALELAWAATLAPTATRTPLRLLRDRCVVYVGGRPGAAPMLEQLVTAAGGSLLHHDGGIEDRKGLLEAMLPRADLVVFPVDAISHDAMHRIKRLCQRHGIVYQPLRTASVASFVDAVAGLARQQELAQAPPPPSHFCLRHG